MSRLDWKCSQVQKYCSNQSKWIFSTWITDGARYVYPRVGKCVTRRDILILYSKPVPVWLSVWFVPLEQVSFVSNKSNLQHRISATGWLLFMRCVSFTFVRLLPTWTPTEIVDSFWAKHFSDCDSIICPIKSKLRFLKVYVKFWKGLGTFKQTEYFGILIAVVALMLSVTLVPRVPVVNF